MIRRIIVAVSLIFTNFEISCDTQKSKVDAYIADVEKYLNDITTFESDFIQLDKNGRGSMGHFFLKRPFLMKMDYKNPPTHVLIAKNNKIIHYDRELKEKTETSMYSSPLSFFLERKINLRENLKILSVQDVDDMLAIKFCKKDDDEEGAVTLIFSKNPLMLRKWIVFPNKNDESLSETTEISLINWKFKHKISDDEFNKF
ncbi:MAG: outer membrane lipoprotein carrier protein LolA [Holosporaceae bacterium]|jgi:outer membrane lipoprotein-sorting protein|nr:outer membrane lipoprotein carrier protein LolA [Holosporaceae bacterium]